MKCNPKTTDAPGIYCCVRCGKQNPRPINKPFVAECGVLFPSRKTVDLPPLLTRLAELTNHPEIIDQPQAYGRAVQIWAAGIPDTAEPFEVRDDSEVEFCLALCRENVCGKHQGGICKPSCGPGMILAVKARMASESCPWIGNRW